MTGQIVDCWNRIGVRGDASCPELGQRGHCRTCPTYSAAATEILDRDAPPDYLAERTRHFEQTDDGGESETQSAILFRLGAEWFALPIPAFEEVLDLRAIRVLPHRRGGAVLGVVNVRGELVVCLSLAKIIGLAEAGTEAAGERLNGRRLIVLRHAEGRVAFPVEEVQRIHRFDPAAVRAVPATIAKTDANFADGVLPWSDRSVGLLDGYRLAEVLNRAVA